MITITMAINDNNNNNYNNTVIIFIISVYYSKTVLMCNLRCFRCILVHPRILQLFLK